MRSPKELSQDGHTASILKLKGTFEGEIQWCSKLSLSDWKTHYLRITSDGALMHMMEGRTAKGLETAVIAFKQEDSSSKHAIVRNLQQCSIQILNSKQAIPILRIEVNNQEQPNYYLQALSPIKFKELFSALTWWSALRRDGIFNKIKLFKYPVSKRHRSNPENLLVCQLNVFGPIPQSVVAKKLDNAVLSNFPKPLLCDQTCDYDWLSVMGVLSSDGSVKFICQNDGAVIFSIDTKQLLRSEISILSPSLFQNSHCLILDALPQLRQQLQLFDKETLYGKVNNNTPESLVLQFPLRIDMEDWLVALKSFAIAERLSLTGSDKSNELRVANKFKISVLEANLEGINLDTNHESGYGLQVEILLWDRVVARTPLVCNTNTPFWREEYEFNETVDVKNISLRLQQTKFSTTGNPSSKTLAIIDLTQDMLNSQDYLNETRRPLFSCENKNFQLGNLCFKINSNLNFVLPPVNFVQFEKLLSKLSLAHITERVYHYMNSEEGSPQLRDVSQICLDVFQSVGREDEWFQTLLENEIASIDKAVLKNSSNNLTNVHIYNSLFRGNSIFTKSIEIYFYRVGSEYLEKAIGGILRAIIRERKSCEIDPSRIKLDGAELSRTVEENRKRLTKWAGRLWRVIYETSNDLPEEIKRQLKNMRRYLEKTCIDGTSQVNLQGVSGILFLRFFCPVILNPKLFNLTEYHLTDETRRTVTLITKVLLGLSTLTPFGQKEPWMPIMNGFIDAHENELLEYVDKVTEKKLDFNEAKLKLSKNLVRPKLMVDTSILKELPSIPYLIDKYLMFSDFVGLLNKTNPDREATPKADEILNVRRSQIAAIGELEFEKITENNTDIFGDDFMQKLHLNGNEQDEKDGLSVESSTKLKSRGDEAGALESLLQEASLLGHKLERLMNVLTDYEHPAEAILGNQKYSQLLAERLYITADGHVVFDRNDTFARKSRFKRVFDGENEGFDYSQYCASLNDPHQSPVQLSSSGTSSSAGDSATIPKRTLSKLTSEKLSRMIKGDTTAAKDAGTYSKGETKSSFKLGRWFSKKLNANDTE